MGAEHADGSAWFTGLGPGLIFRYDWRNETAGGLKDGIHRVEGLSKCSGIGSSGLSSSACSAPITFLHLR